MITAYTTVLLIQMLRNNVMKRCNLTTKKSTSVATLDSDKFKTAQNSNNLRLNGHTSFEFLCIGREDGWSWR